jgi:hypothetical protein
MGSCPIPGYNFPDGDGSDRTRAPSERRAIRPDQALRRDDNGGFFAELSDGLRLRHMHGVAALGLDKYQLGFVRHGGWAKAA